MDNKTVIIEGYQPVSAIHKITQGMPAPAAMTKIIPPRGGTGETMLKAQTKSGGTYDDRSND
jgi:hypothetical protein